MKYIKNTYCSFCGTMFTVPLQFPKQCVHCRSSTYVNPLPVAVLLLPVEEGLLTIRRNIEPRKGMLALPGGFIELGESWQQAAARELQEEAGISISSEEVSLFDVHSAPDGTVLVFGLAAGRHLADLPVFEANSETSEIAFINAPCELAFPLHSRVVEKYFAEKKPR